MAPQLTRINFCLIASKSPPKLKLGQGAHEVFCFSIGIADGKLNSSSSLGRGMEFWAQMCRRLEQCSGNIDGKQDNRRQFHDG